MRLRIRYTKRGKIRFTSHRDTARVWERTVRRAQLPVAYSQGFSPHARLSFGLALSTAFESDAEYLDIDLDPARAGDVDVSALASQLSALLPDGMRATVVAELPTGALSLQQIVTSCEYVIDLTADARASAADHDSLRERVAGAIDRIRSAESVVVTRERKGVVGTADIRPAILVLEHEPSPSGSWSGEPSPSGGAVRVRAELATQPKAVRPSELLEAIAIDAHARVRRTHQWIELEGLRTEPLPADQFGDAAVRLAASSAGTIAPFASAPAVREELFDARLRGPRFGGLRQIS